ncbi:multidrug efflux pump subunit AcrB [Rhodobium orientis]|uniref:ACR family transporter n=1 Tax=Rhodobium orientis TaxID=34017 RepID=A0A327JEY3_9HYPH|nr:efflux RND transporter permease subunit [Rhodobium orientis]MBB4305593.1 multidrug efflux pump subunit AcrB [Rhodobium orientis]MBK5950857.1 ACR family transporter [Rhodobium orientis]RAI24977.1 ACR family transporter [Rhodobium orientis]
MKGFNLSEWTLQHRSLVWYIMLVSLVAGVMAYFSLGRAEDPSFTIKTMIIGGSLPGASVTETQKQVTDRIEKEMEELDELDFTRSVTMPGQAIVYVELLPTTPAKDIPRIWQRVRNMMNDVRGEFPSEFGGFQFNDTFGDVFGNIYAFTADGFSPRELRDWVEKVRARIHQLPDAGKVDMFGERDERIYLEFSPRRLAALGLDQEKVLNTLSAQNAIAPSGVINAGPERILVRVGGQFSSEESLEAVNLRVGDRFFRLADVASIRRGYVDPPSELFRYDGKDAIGLAIGMRDGANILEFGEELETAIAAAKAELPIGIDIHQVADQPAVVDDAVGHFVQALAEAVAIVLLVSFISLGFRAGFVVTLTIPLVLAITFMVMLAYGIDLQRISLGALIIALGLLVDDAMIAIETMIARLELGDNLEKAASYAWTSIAFPMFSGTLVTVAGFIPIGLNNSNAGEFTFSLFVVIAVSLLVSWIAAVLFAPLIGVTVLPKELKHAHQGPGRSRRAFQSILLTAMRHRWLTIATTVLLFAASVVGMAFVQQQFFPSSDRPELIVDVTLPQNASIAGTSDTIERLESFLAEQDEALFFSSYIGTSAPRFLLSYDVQTPGPYMGQIVIQTPSVEARNTLKAKLDSLGEKQFPGADIFVKLLEVGPPVGRPIQYRISGPDIETLRDRARRLASLLGSQDRLSNVAMDWNEPARVVRVDIVQDKARQLGISGRDIAGALQAIFDGNTVTALRDDIYLVDIVARGQAKERKSVESLYNLQITGESGEPIPLSSFATFRFDTEPPLIHQRSRQPTVTVQALIASREQPATVVKALEPTIAAFEEDLPPDYKIAIGGVVESSEESQAPIVAVVPLMAVTMLTLIMLQMQSFRLMFIVLCAAPPGLIGVVAALLPSGTPLGFVAILGVLALVGILIRNSIILVQEIEVLRLGGASRWDAVFKASDSRARPIALTAAAASLALIPIARQIFWGPMAVAMMGGIIAGTAVTLLFIPALYLAVFRVPREAR